MSIIQEYAHYRIPLEDIRSATNNFSDLIREGEFSRTYKGQLLLSGETIDIVAKRLDPKYGQRNTEFSTEISMLTSLKHENLVSFIGFCDQDEEKIIIYRYEANSSLDKYISDPTLTWMQRLKICVGVARALSYIYFDARREFSVIHRNIRSSTVLLDHNWKPKLSGFEHSIKNPAARRHLPLLAEFCGTHGYLDPTYEKNGFVTHMSDIYSLGVVLFEVLCGRMAFVPGENEKLLSQMAMSSYEKGRLDDMISPDLRKQMEEQSYKIFSETAYRCLTEKRPQRPNIDQVLQRLEKALELQHKYECGPTFEEACRRTYVSSLNMIKPPSFGSTYLNVSPRHSLAKAPSLENISRKKSTLLSHTNAPSHENISRKKSTLLSHTNPPSLGNIFRKKSTLLSHTNLPVVQPLSFGRIYLNVSPRLSPPPLFGSISQKDSSLLSPEKVNGHIMSFSFNEFAHLRITLEDISSATSNFADENLLGDGRAGKLYRGQLKSYGRLTDIVVRRLEGEMELWREVSMLWSLNHDNLASIYGFCDANGEKIVVYEHSVHGCLDKQLTDATLTWSQRLQICLGVARALDYVHYDAIHCDVCSSKILLDKDRKAMVFGFELSTRYPGNWMHRLIVSHDHKDPFRLTPKYDVYSFGLLLYDVLCEGKPVSRDNGTVKKKLDEMINPELRKHISTQSMTTLSTLADNCLNKEYAKRPPMDVIVKQLESMLKQPGDSEHSTPADEAKPSDILTNEKKERLKIRLRDIKLATNDFSETSCLGTGGYGKVYEGELDHLDIQNIRDWKSEEELPKKRSSVAIKRIFNKQGEEGFLAELQTLTSCNHPHIVSLLGYCCEDGEMILVFELASKGSLDDCLEKNQMANVTWAQRIQICLEVARGLNYIHNLEGKGRIVHRDIKSANILLDENWNAKVADFGLSKFNSADQQASTIHTMRAAGTYYYMDPEFSTSNTYKKESDIYSFGVVLFEMLSGRLAYDQVYTTEDEKGLAVVARRRFEDGTIKELIDPNMMEEANEHFFTVNKEPNQKSLDAFTRIAYQCLVDTKVRRPKMEDIIKELEDALKYQGKSLILSKFRLTDIVAATENFSPKYCIGAGAYGMMYNTKLDYFDRKSFSEIQVTKAGDQLPKRRGNLGLKRIFNRGDVHGKQGLFLEIDLLASFKHPNIVSLLGVSNDNKEMIIIYEDDFKGSLHDCLGHPHKMAHLTWAQRIQISLDIAQGLNYLQSCSVEDKQRVMHFAMHSANILLDAEWRAKIACFWLSNFISADKEANILNISNIVPKQVQSDPEYIKIEKLKKESGIYSFGVILFEIMCGKVQYDTTYYAEKEKGLPVIARRCFEEKTLLDLMLDPNLKRGTDDKICVLIEEVNQESFDAFSKIAYECCALRQADRPSMEIIIRELEKAKNIQVEHFKHLKNGVVEKVKNSVPSIALEDISSATKNFSTDNIIGFGGYSNVYKAKLSRFDSPVAIKRISGRKDEEGSNGFLAELQTLSNRKHDNIVSLLGFCLEKHEMILVLEYASKGSLDRILRNSDKMTKLTWAQRIKICLHIASGLAYLHTIIEGKQTIHRDIKSANILLNDNWVAKITDFGLCKLNHAHHQSNNMNTNIIAGTDVYLDPEYIKTGKLKVESDIYSFGVVLFEIMCGKLAYDETFGEGGLPAVARKCIQLGTLMQIIDPRMSQDDETKFLVNGGLNQDSLSTFSKIAYQCIAERQCDRPNINTVARELEKAYYYQKNSLGMLRIALEDIRLMTKSFSDSMCMEEGRCWQQYKGQMTKDNKYNTVVAKRFDSKSDKQDHYFRRELEILVDCKHENIIGLVGYCQDTKEKIIVYEHALNGRLDEHLDDASVTWMKRLKISIDIARGLHFLHKDGVTKDFWIMHTDIKSANILINGDWKAKISNLESSLYHGERDQIKLVADTAYSSLGYVDPKYNQSDHLTHKSDIYSLGVVLLEMLCGRLACREGCKDHSHSLGPLSKQLFNKEGNLDKLVFEGMKEQIDRKSLDTFVAIALKCLEDDVSKRPEAEEVAVQLKKALEFQEDLEIWEPKLREYKDMLHPSEMDKNTKRDIYNKLSQGLLLRDREVFFTLGSNEEKQYMISAKKFSYKHQWALKWHQKPQSTSKKPSPRSQVPQPASQIPQPAVSHVPQPSSNIPKPGSHIPQSRFDYVAEMLTRSKLNIKSKIKTQILSPGFKYGVHMVFKFSGPRKLPAKSIYVNLTYKIGSETFHAYFATWKDKDWMTIELYRFLNHKGDSNFEVLLESFSSYYCGKGAIYIEGIEFRVIENGKQKEIKETKQVQQVLKSNSDQGQVQQLPSDYEETLRSSKDDKADKLFLVNEVIKKKHLMLSEKEVFYNKHHEKHYHLKPSSESRLQEVIELQKEHVLRISCKIESQMLSKDTEYSCYLVFKLSKNCDGLHCPVKVRDAFNRRNKDVKNIYLRSPSAWNLHPFNHIPEQREDGWMEVNVWNFNSNQNLKNDCYKLKLKLISYEGTMAGLIACGLEFRPV